MKIEHLESFNWEGALRGMRNPLESWGRGDSSWEGANVIKRCPSGLWDDLGYNPKHSYTLGPNDLKLAKQLIKAGPSHRKFLRQLTISCDVVAPEKWWAEFDTYEYTVENSTSMMHTMGNRLLTADDFCEDVAPTLINVLNARIEIWQENKTEENWRIIIMCCPMGFIYRRTLTFNYEVFMAMYNTRKNHKLKEWKEFCEFLRKELPYMNTFIKVLED